jgi:hypothetical protein
MTGLPLHTLGFSSILRVDLILRLHEVCFGDFSIIGGKQDGTLMNADAR